MVNTMELSTELIEDISTINAIGTIASKLFLEPCDKDLAESLSQTHITPEMFTTVDAQVAVDGYTGMKSYFSEFSQDKLYQASVDFHRLFVGPDKLLAAPWSSVYLNRGYLFGEAEQRAELHYKAHGLQNPEGHRAPCDHVAYEIQFMCELLQRAIASQEQDNGKDTARVIEDAHAFYTECITPWIEMFLTKTEDKAATEFYKNLAVFCRGYVALLDQLFKRLEA